MGTEGGDLKRELDSNKCGVNRGVEMWSVDVYEEGGRSVSQVNVMVTVSPAEDNRDKQGDGCPQSGHPSGVSAEKGPGAVDISGEPSDATALAKAAVGTVSMVTQPGQTVTR